MKLAELPDDFTPQQFRTLDKESLDAIPYKLQKWFCQCKGCSNGTTVRDYGIGWWFLHRNSKHAAKNPHDYWMGANNFWLCGKHLKIYDRLKKRFELHHVQFKLLDPYKTKRADMREGKWDALTTVRKIEQPTANNRTSSTVAADPYGGERPPGDARKT